MPDFLTPQRQQTPHLSQDGAGSGFNLQDDATADILCGDDLPLLGAQPGTMWTGQGRNPAYAAYADLLSQRTTDLVLLEDADQRKRLAHGLLTQASRVAFMLTLGQELDVSLIPEPVELGWSLSPGETMPPEWISPTRSLLTITGQFRETRDSSGELFDGMDLGSLGTDGADYGVPLYRTQSDNLASPDATCNTTSTSMALERLGYSRSDVMAAIERELKIREIRAEQGRSYQPTDAELDAHQLADDAWETAAQRFFDQEQGRSKNYQRLRSGGVTDQQEEAWAPQFRDMAQMEDLVHMLINMMGIERTAINSGSNPQRIVDAVHGDSPLAKPETEQLWISSWARVSDQVREVLEGGGAATLSVDHKSHGTRGSHIVTIQEVRSDGIVVDDPYGDVHSGFAVDRDTHSDAYKRGGSRVLRDPNASDWTANQIDTEHDTDWMRTSGRTSDELKGDTSFWSSEQVEAMTNGRYVVLYRRGVQGQGSALAPERSPRPQPRPERSLAPERVPRPQPRPSRG